MIQQTKIMKDPADLMKRQQKSGHLPNDHFNIEGACL